MILHGHGDKAFLFGLSVFEVFTRIWTCRQEIICILGIALLIKGDIVIKDYRQLRWSTGDTRVL